MKRKNLIFAAVMGGILITRAKPIQKYAGQLI
jgi:hypothetical protein